MIAAATDPRELLNGKPVAMDDGMKIVAQPRGEKKRRGFHNLNGFIIPGGSCTMGSQRLCESRWEVSAETSLWSH